MFRPKTLDLDDVVSELTLDWADDVARFGGKDDILKFRHHLPATEPSEIAADVLRPGVLGVLGGQGRKVAARAGDGGDAVGTEFGLTARHLRRVGSQAEKDMSGACLFTLEEFIDVLIVVCPQFNLIDRQGSVATGRFPRAGSESIRSSSRR